MKRLKDQFNELYELERLGEPIAPYYCDVELPEAISATKAYAIALEDYKERHAKAKRTPDAFVRWYLEQSATVRNALRIFATDNHGFKDGIMVDTSNASPEEAERLMHGRGFPPEVEAEARFHSRLHSFCSEKTRMGDKKAFGRYMAAEKYRKKHPKRRAHEINAALAATLLGIVKATFENRIARGEYTPEQVGEHRLNERVKLYDGNAILEIAFRELVAAECVKPAPQPSLNQYRPGN